MWKISAWGASLMRMPEDNGGSAHSRYRALLDVSAALVEQPTVKAVLHSLREVLSSSVRLHGTDLYLLDSGRDTLHLLEFDRAGDAPGIRIGTKISRIGAAAQALDQKEPVFLPDVSEEMLKHPELAPFAAQSSGRSTYVFPLFTAQQQYGLLTVTKERGQEFTREDVELLRSLTSHVALALECALARDSAEQYQRELATERDRLRLLLEINNHVVSKLDMDDLFRSASASIRSYFGNHLTGFWLLEKDSHRLQSVVLDFPDAKGLLAEVGSTDLTEMEYEKLRARRSDIWSIDDIDRLPTNIGETLRAQSITSVAVAPLATGSGPLGLLAIGSRKPDAFAQEDLDLLTQISIQISLAL
ncbi:MAG TPA: GAF domain-containing protein, partial [Candidatus Acidoferrum sp.]|nr:GAF domain-containing protein [Candidatus Acidoferrum sp.]